jgi:hypothetical protein
MKKIKLFDQFVSENTTKLTEALDAGVVTKVVKLQFDISDEIKIDDEVLLALGPDAAGMFSIAEDIEKWTGLKKADAEAYDTKPTDAYLYGMSNVMNGGANMFLWITMDRLKGDAESSGSLFAAMMDVLPHECFHLAKKVLVRHQAKKLGVSLEGDEWIKHDYGQGEYVWPSEGDHKDPMVVMSEEDFAWIYGYITKAVAPVFIELGKTMIPELENFEI